MNNPILDILKGENLKRINIDRELLPSFIKAIGLIGISFAQNGYTQIKPWNILFNNMLYKNSSNPLTIKCKEIINDNANELGLYNPIKNTIKIKRNDEDTMCSTLIHELLHYLSSITDKSIDKYGPRYSFIMDEGLAELFKLKIEERDTMSCYEDEVKLAALYQALSKDNDKKSDVFKEYLNNSYTFIKPESAIRINTASNRYEDFRNPEEFIKVQREILKSLTDSTRIYSIKELISLIEIIASRPSSDISYIREFYKSIAYNVNKNIRTSIPKFENILYEFCLIADKYYLYDEEEVCELNCGDLILPIDRDYTYYNPFPSDSVSSINISNLKDSVTVSYKGKNHHVDKKKMLFVNWKEYFDQYLEYFNSIGLIDSYNPQNRIK